MASAKGDRYAVIKESHFNFLGGLWFYEKIALQPAWIVFSAMECRSRLPFCISQVLMKQKIDAKMLAGLMEGLASIFVF